MITKFVQIAKIAAGAGLALVTLGLDAHAAPGGAMFRVAIDQARPLNLSAAAAGVVVGNPAIAGVSLQSDRLLFVTGRSYGITNLIVVGANGRPIYESRISVVPDENGSTVMVTKGTSTVRHDCAPVCRRTPDIADDTNAFDEVSKQVATHAGAANQ